MGACPGSRPSDEAASCTASSPSGFDPARCWWMKGIAADRDTCGCPLCRKAIAESPYLYARETAEETAAAELVLLWTGAFGRGGAAVRAGAILGVRAAKAIATEAQRAATGNTGVVHEGAGRQASPKHQQETEQ